MSTFPLYGTTEGPLGFPMQDADAKALDEFIRTLPEQDYQRVIVEKAMTELSQGERADVSWICTESIDRQREIVLTSGFRDDHYKNNPIVMLNHDYIKQPVGKSLWRKRVRDGAFSCHQGQDGLSAAPRRLAERSSLGAVAGESWEAEMKAITIQQPWAEMIARGLKRVENRTWRTSHRGPLAIHAGKSMATLDRENAAEWPERYGATAGR